MAVIARPIADVAVPQFPNRTILCLELEKPAHLLLWAARRYVEAGYDYATVRQTLTNICGAPNRSAVILLSLLITEITAMSLKPVQIGLPYDQHVHMDELLLLATLDRIQTQESLHATMLMRLLCASERVDSARQTAEFLAQTLLESGARIDVMRFLPRDAVPSIH